MKLHLLILHALYSQRDSVDAHHTYRFQIRPVHSTLHSQRLLAARRILANVFVYSPQWSSYTFVYFQWRLYSFPMKRSISLLRLGFGRLLITLSHNRKKSNGARIASDNYRAPQLKFLVRLKGGLHVSFSLKL